MNIIKYALIAVSVFIFFSATAPSEPHAANIAASAIVKKDEATLRWFSFRETTKELAAKKFDLKFEPSQVAKYTYEAVDNTNLNPRYMRMYRLSITLNDGQQKDIYFLLGKNTATNAWGLTYKVPNELKIAGVPVKEAGITLL